MVMIGSSPTSGDWVGQMIALQREIRGGLLDAAITVERAVDLILANHFCKPQGERWWQLYTLVLASGNMTFQRKSEIVLELLRISYPHLLKQYPSIKAGLERVRKDRNRVAHLEAGMSAGFGTGHPPDHINFVVYRGGRRSVLRLTRAKAAQMEREAIKVFLELAEIAKAVHPN